MNLDWSHAKDLLFLAMVSTISIYVANKVKAVADSVETLNINIAKLLERVDGHEKRISRIEDKL